MSQSNVFWLFICSRERRAYHKISRAKGAVMQTWLSNTFDVLDIIMYLLTGPPWLGTEKKFQNYSSQKGVKRCFEIGFCKFIIS